MEGIIAGYNVYIECRKCDGDRATILPSLSVEQYEQFVLSSASGARQYLLQHIVDYSTRRYDVLPLCELAALCPFYLPRALENIQETPQDLTLWLKAIQNGNLDRRTYATLFRILRLLLSESESYKNILNLLNVQMSILQCHISRLDFTLPLLETTRIFTEHLMEGDPWHNRIRDLKMINSQFSTMVPSLEEFEKSCVILHDVQKVILLGNRYLPESFGTADEVVDVNLEIPTSQLQAARNVLVWMETHDDWFHHLQPSLAIPTDLAEFQTYLATPHARIRTQYILRRLSNEGFYSRQWLLLLYTLAALCPLWFPTAGAGGDLILLVHAFHINEMTPTSFKVLHQILSIATFHNPPSKLAKDLQTIQKRSQWTAGDFEESLASAISYFQDMFQLQSQFYGMVPILAVKHQVKSEEPLQSIATLLRALKHRQEYQISNPSEGPQLFSESPRTHSFQSPSASIHKSISGTNFLPDYIEGGAFPSTLMGYEDRTWISTQDSRVGKSYTLPIRHGRSYPEHDHDQVSKSVPPSTETRLLCPPVADMMPKGVHFDPYMISDPSKNPESVPFMRPSASTCESTVDTDCSPLAFILTTDSPINPASDQKKIHEKENLRTHSFQIPSASTLESISSTSSASHNERLSVLPSPKSATTFYECSWEQCGKSFGLKADLERHYRIHTNKRPYHCTEPNCNKSFAQKCSLTVHLRVHTGEKPFVCDYKDCGKAFSDSSGLRQHRRIHDPKQIAEQRLLSRRWFCDQCGKSLRHKYDLNRHRRIHTNDRPHHCTEPNCNKRFIQRSALILHLRTHTGERPFLCDYEGCGKDFHSVSINRLVQLSRVVAD
ncbi:zinc finger protein, putative [Talaromyces stipitatus ATCC 10500]|uniref:Zinc finger protein, putative n=1 Tax=Talaromyces stipitatus (strain ATCC 10500 / CBS 375.48 / QM 6759 / NRRL 1006) TaxID=441959 RepID=B8M016_TALSN|nr:zinc finger protein, putative [Talaromyces stipitatus ATCC 10500]EED20948.1 zinc finger protein, putative [Talaromyces stipitatus ATCC 10500]